ncbi:MAG: hypothetical protein V4490_05085 [Pseudomonadota bacterium]
MRANIYSENELREKERELRETYRTKYNVWVGTESNLDFCKSAMAKKPSKANDNALITAEAANKVYSGPRQAAAVNLALVIYVRLLTDPEKTHRETVHANYVNDTILSGHQRRELDLVNKEVKFINTCENYLAEFRRNIPRVRQFDAQSKALDVYTAHHPELPPVTQGDPTQELTYPDTTLLTSDLDLYLAADLAYRESKDAASRLQPNPNPAPSPQAVPEQQHATAGARVAPQPTDNLTRTPAPVTLAPQAVSQEQRETKHARRNAAASVNQAKEHRSADQPFSFLRILRQIVSPFVFVGMLVRSLFRDNDDEIGHFKRAWQWTGDFAKGQPHSDNPNTLPQENTIPLGADAAAGNRESHNVQPNPNPETPVAQAGLITAPSHRGNMPH